MYLNKKNLWISKLYKKLKNKFYNFYIIIKYINL